jgi:hypothetical protein
VFATSSRRMGLFTGPMVNVEATGSAQSLDQQRIAAAKQHVSHGSRSGTACQYRLDWRRGSFGVTNTELFQHLVIPADETDWPIGPRFDSHVDPGGGRRS